MVAVYCVVRGSPLKKAVGHGISSYPSSLIRRCAKLLSLTVDFGIGSDPVVELKTRIDGAVARIGAREGLVVFDRRGRQER